MKYFCVLLILVPLFVAAEEPAWHANYEKALQLIAQANYEDAVGYLRMAAADKPISEVIGSGKEGMEYLPYLQMGICYMHLGKSQLASQFFDLEEALPAVKQSTGGMALLKEYRSKAGKSAAGSATAEKTIRDYTKKGYLLPDSEVTTMKEEIRQKCRLPRGDEKAYPWYYHYELGIALKGKSDWQRALDSFIEALDDRDRPQKFSRIYGMWYIDYYPYYYIGLAHYHLGNWKCADSSFVLSQMMEDIPKDSEEYKNLVELKTESEKRLADSQ